MKLRASAGILCLLCMAGCGGSSGDSFVGSREDDASAPDWISSTGESETHDTERYNRIDDNAFLGVRAHPLSTFSIDVDTAAYANVRRFLNDRQLPPPDAVRIEELVNYFSYDYEPPVGDEPFAVHTELTDCPWAAGHQLLRIGLKGRVIDEEERPASNLVFLIDVSGSMQSSDKLPLLQRALTLLTGQMTRDDRIAIVVYAGSSGVALPSTPGDEQGRIVDAIAGLRAGGSTNGGAGIELAYRIARENFVEGGSNRVILATDGDFNVGVTSNGDLTRLIERQRESGVFLSVLGFGTGNYNDAAMEQLADRGNGNYAYIDSYEEARKVLVEQIDGTLITIAKDVKIQIEFNPLQVAEYRLIGYENRVLQAEEFNDDRADAGEIGAGHTVTALYEIVPAGSGGAAGAVDPLKYQNATLTENSIASDDLCTIKLRYKQPDWVTSRLLEREIDNATRQFADSSVDHRFAASVAAFGMLLRRSPYSGDADWSQVTGIARRAAGVDREGYRSEFLQLAYAAAQLDVSRSMETATAAVR